ncbi:hypothetical protein [Hyalangium rubrum]|uniref:DUF2380 domain-containing protein n=1 Tax=Hyalangium rubrum TaxID=3103134 RepID=A0ABU5HH10_9BACT|nr:hypothetical protein [Hyalangium sp. s54d21]MDY7232434.1 hypothetical protein [Hyalangium sp. s54d21]
MRHWWWLCLLPALCWAEPLKLAIPGITVVDMDPQRATFLSEHLAQQLADEGAEVISSQDLGVMLGLERQRQLLGCTGRKCTSALSDAIDVDALVMGDVASLPNNRFQLNLRMLDSVKGARVRTYNRRVVGFEAVLDEMEKAAKQLVTAGNKKFGRTSVPVVKPPPPPPVVEQPPPPPVVVEQPPPPPPEPVVKPEPVAPPPPPAPVLPPKIKEGAARRWAWVPATVGGVAMGAGLVLWNDSEARYQQLRDGTDRPYAVSLEIADGGRSRQNLARVSMGVGGALILTGAAMALFGAPPSVEPQVAVGREHVSVGIAGVLP